MKVKILLYSCFMALVIIACSEHTVQPPAELANGRVTGTVHGLVYDNTTQSLFSTDEVTVTWVADGATHSTTTDSIGYYIITDLPPGDYTIHFIRSSVYAVGQIEVHVPTLEEILYSAGELGGPPPTDRDYEHTVSEDITLYKKNAGIQGTVYKKLNNDITPAVGVSVIADHDINYNDMEDHDSYNIHPDSYSTLTNSSGFFSFDSLPSTPQVKIITLPYNSDDNEYACTEHTETLCRNQTRTMDDIVLPVNSPEPFITQNNFFNVHNFPISDDLTCTFSKTMQTSEFDFSLMHDFTNVECETSWSNDITLTIDPGVDLLPDTYYTITLYGKSADGHNFYLDTTFATQKGIEFISTNLERVEDVYDQFPVDEEITLTFSMAVNLNNPDSELYIEDEDGNPVYFETPTLSSDSKTITITHPDNDLEPEQDYTLTYDIYSTIPGDYVSGDIEFSTASTDQVPGRVTGFSLISPGSGNVDWNTTSFTFRWNTLESADEYAIVAEDSYHNSNRIVIDGTDDIDYMTRQTLSVTLPTEFDYYEDDGMQTPFLNETEVTFYIIARNDAGRGPISTGIVLSDRTSPSITIDNQTGGSANNSGGSNAKNVYVTFHASEYLSEVENNFTSGSTLDDDAITNFSWNSSDHDKDGGTIRITVPAGTNGAGDDLVITCTDTNGNSESLTYTLN